MLRGHPLYRVTAVEVLADTRNGKWKSSDHRRVSSPPTCVRACRAMLLRPGYSALPSCSLPCRFLKLLKSGTNPQRYASGLYFAYGGDPTLSQQRYEAVQADPHAAGLAPWQRAAPSFFWNRALSQPLLGECCSSACLLAVGRGWAVGRRCSGGASSRGSPSFHASASWWCDSAPFPPCTLIADAGMHRFVPPIFQGFAGQITGVRLGGAARTHTATITLLARRSLKRVGCRQWRRGSDLEAAVANFVESEQLIVVDGGAVQAAFVQVCVFGGGLLCTLLARLIARPSPHLPDPLQPAAPRPPAHLGAWLHPPAVEPDSLPQVQDPHPHCAALALPARLCGPRS